MNQQRETGLAEFHSWAEETASKVLKRSYPGSEAIAKINRAKTHCPHGHPYSGDNLHVDYRGYRYCIACRKRRKR